MSVRSAVDFRNPEVPVGTQNLESVLVVGDSGNQQSITSINDLACHTINGQPIGGGGGNQGLASVLGVSPIGDGKDITDVGDITCKTIIESGRGKYFEYIVGDTFNVPNATAFQLDISGGQITLAEGSYIFNFTINLSSNIAVNNYIIQLDLDGAIIGQTTVQAPNIVSLDFTTLIINSIPVTVVSLASGVVTLRCIANAATYPVTVTLQGTPNNLFSYLSWVEVYLGPVPPPLGYPLSLTSGQGPTQIDINGNEYIYYMTIEGSSILTPNYPFTLDEIFVVGAGQNGSTPVGGNGGGVVSYLTPSITVGNTNAFNISVAKNGGVSTASVNNTSPLIDLDSSTGTVALGGAANTQGNPGTLYATTGITYGGSGAGGGYNLSSQAQQGRNGGVGGGGGSGQYTVSDFGTDGGAGGGNGINLGGAGGNPSQNGTSSQYGGGGGGGGPQGYVTSGGNGGTNGGGAGGGGAQSVGGGGGGGQNLGGGGGGGAQSQYFAANGGGGGSGIVIIKLTLL